MKNIIVTGCAGFIGSHLCEKLLKDGSFVLGVDNFDPFYSRSIKESNMRNFINHPNFKFLEFDLSNKEELNKQLKGTNANLIIHLAGKAGVRPSIENPESYIRANIISTQNILSFMKDNGIKKLAFASSSSIYGNTKDTPFNEDQDVNKPISPYAFTKKACELLNYTYHALYGIDILNLRFFTVFGPRQRPDLAIHKFTRLILNNQEIPMFGDGSTARDYTYFEDTINGICLSAEYLFKYKNVFEIINLGNNHPVKLLDLIATIEKATGEKAKIKQLPMQSGDVEITYANIDKAKRLLGYQPKYSFKEGINNFIVWYKQINHI